MRTVVFDLDGTLADTSVDLIRAANGCFRARGLPDLLVPGADTRTSFHGAKAMLKLGYIRAGFPEAEVATLTETDYRPLLIRYGEDISRGTTLYPGAREAVTALRKGGFATAICTNKPEALARQLIADIGLAELFDALIGADTLPVHKPDPAPYFAAVREAGGTLSRSLMVGDTETDRETARRAGVPCVLVGFGPEKVEIRRLAPEAELDDYADLPSLADALLPR